jgi:hypothetical protein
MSETKYDKVVNLTVEKDSGSKAKASVTKDGKTRQATGDSVEEAIAGAKDKAKG